MNDVPLNINTIPLSEIKKAKLLRIEVIEGQNKGEFWTINACGLFEGDEFIGRARRDGCVLFGSQEYSEDLREFYNDIIIKDEEETSGIGKRHFIIKYNTETHNYYI